MNSNCRIASWRGLVFVTVAACCCSACVQTKLTEPPRSSVEQLLLSTAADRALQATNLSIFSNQKVFVSTNYFESYDVKYALGTVRDALSRAGALLVNEEAQADVIVEPRSGALSTDGSQSLVGIPNTGVAIPFAGTIPIPEIALYKSELQFSTAKIALLAYSTRSHAHFFSSGPMVGKAEIKYYKFLGYISYTRTDLPEKQKAPKRKPQFTDFSSQSRPR